MNAIAALIVAASLWAADRTLRFSRWLFYGYGNYCKLTPLPEGATRVTMHRSVKAGPGSHAFLWIPSVRRFQTHPFTLVSNNPAEFVIAGHEGFTKELHNLAIQSPKAMRRAAIEGPYGNVPSTADFDKVILIAGGSGATFTLALAMDWLRHQRTSDGNGNKILEFIWTIKNKDYLSWFEHDLQELQSSPWVSLKIHVTAPKICKEDISPPMTSASEEQRLFSQNSNLPALVRQNSLRSITELGRPDIDIVVKQVVDNTHRDGRILVAASGPGSLLASTRMAVKGCMSSDAASIHLHTEEFDGF